MDQPRTRQRPLWHPAEWPAWLGIAAISGVARLPYRLNFQLFSALGWLLSWLLRWHPRARIAQRNIALCFPELSAKEQRRAYLHNLQNTGHLLGEFCFAWAASRSALDRIPVQFKGLEHLQQAAAQGRGVLLTGVHMSHLELCGRLLAERTGLLPIAGMYREHASAAMEQRVLHWRARYTQAMFRRDELRASIRWLKSGKMLWYAPDQDYRRGDSLFVPFFGQAAATLSATHQLARLSGAAVLGFQHQRLPDGGFVIEILPAIPDFPSSDVRDDTTRVNQMLEQIIRQAPEQYLWLHKRFKSRPEGALDLY
jgi:Kdo2-lipid IVA lauroyltransferase/acyltransferase